MRMDSLSLKEWNDFLDEISSEISEILDYEKNPWLDGIIELTYWYKTLKNGGRFNTTLFNKFCGIDIREWELYEISSWNIISPVELLERFKAKSQKIIDTLEYILMSLQSNNQISDVVRYNSIVSSINNVITLILYAQNSIEFEIEKAWFDVWLSQEVREAKREANEEFEKQLYGWKIIDNSLESVLICDFLDSNLREYQEKDSSEKQLRVDAWAASRVLTPDELERLSNYISKIKRVVKNKYIQQWEDKNTNQKNPKKIKSETKKFFDSIEHVTISREDAVYIFNQVLKFFSLPQNVRVSWEVQSIYDSPAELIIPESQEFSSLWVERVLKLISHEILWHYVNQHNHEQTNGFLRYVWNVEKEEWLAILFEKWLTGMQLSGSSLITPPFARILAGEILSPAEFEDFIDLYCEISERKSSPISLRNRHKRNQEDNYQSVQHKDVAYIRWLIAIVEFLIDWWDIENLFAWKVWLEAIKNWIFKFDENMIFPFLITDIFVFFILSSKTSQPFTHLWFTEYLKSKYGQVIKEESFDKLNVLISQSDILTLFNILRPLSEAILSSWIQWDIAKNISRIHDILNKRK